MPIYEYRCRNGHTFEVMQSMSEDPITSCEHCESSVERVFHPVAVVFKGSGFYTTDYARKSSAKPASDSGSEPSSSASASSSEKGKSGGDAAKPSPAKSASSSD
jgi:putative FmdB family regulatory protein